jgi:hypothetical protein
MMNSAIEVKLSISKYMINWRKEGSNKHQSKISVVMILDSEYTNYLSQY